MLVFTKFDKFKHTKGKREREKKKQTDLLQEKKKYPKHSPFACRRFIAFTMSKMLNFSLGYISWLRDRDSQKSRFEIESQQ